MQHRADDNAQQPLASVLDTMQQTPLVRLDRLTRAYGVSGTILAKLDYLLLIWPLVTRVTGHYS